MINTSISKENLLNYLGSQIENNYSDGDHDNFIISSKVVFEKVMERISFSFSHVKSRYYSTDGQPYFNHLNGDHYCSFLAVLANELYKFGDENSATKAFLLNKMMFGIDAFYTIELPRIFLFVHPIGTILGNATYSDYLVVYQGISIGSKTDGIYPTFSEKTILYSNSSVIGNCNLGPNCVVAARSYIIAKNVEANKVILGSYPDNRIIDNKNDIIKDYFHLL